MSPELCDIPDGLTCYYIPGLQIVGFVSLSELGLSQSEEVKFKKQWMFNNNIMSSIAAPVPLLKDKAQV
jgi:hypothetical protein